MFSKQPPLEGRCIQILKPSVPLGRGLQDEVLGLGHVREVLSNLDAPCAQPVHLVGVSVPLFQHALPGTTSTDEYVTPSSSIPGRSDALRHPFILPTGYLESAMTILTSSMVRGPSHSHQKLPHRSKSAIVSKLVLRHIRCMPPIWVPLKLEHDSHQGFRALTNLCELEHGAAMV
jgi:hypothetical protein